MLPYLVKFVRKHFFAPPPFFGCVERLPRLRMFGVITAKYYTPKKPTCAATGHPVDHWGNPSCGQPFEGLFIHLAHFLTPRSPGLLFSLNSSILFQFELTGNGA